ncbi:hypothetical protein ANN_22182 [Periplaneta americana]|uniref:Endonuclease-reverse transcriptase n=1 Tax=Periplaneta americana TaxID=6978 RepID=A0ABQ8S7P4_PERAM|nr:hypothetical protein ANN_22182 [Periplaneta americana]
MLKLIRKRKRNWLGHWLRRNCLLKDALEGMVNGRKFRDRRRYQMVDDIKIGYVGHMRRLRGRQKIGKTGECWVCSERSAIRQNAIRLRWAGHAARMGEFRNAYRVLVGRPEGKIPLGRPRRRWEDNIKMDLREVGYDGRDWINLAQDRDQWLAYVRAAMNVRVP